MAAISLEDFFGSYIVRQGSYGRGTLQPLPGGGAVTIHSVADQVGSGSDGSPLSLMARVQLPGEAPADYQFDPDNRFLFRIEELPDDGGWVRSQISLMVSDDPRFATFRALYGCFCYEDPDQVAVWGADNNG